MARLDPASIKSWLECVVDWPAGTRLAEVTLNRLWAGWSNRISFELALELSRRNGPATFTLQGGLGRIDRFGSRRTRPRFGRHGLTGLRLLNEDLDIWCCSPDRDRKLRCLRGLMDDAHLTRLLAETAAAPLLELEAAVDGRTTQVRSKIKSYLARKRCTLHARHIGRPGACGVYLKAFRREPGAAQIDRWRDLGRQLEARSNGRVRTPEILEYVREKRLLITAGVDVSASPLGCTSHDISDAAAVLAHLHAGAVRPRIRHHTPADELQAIRRWSASLEFALDCRPTLLARLIGRIEGLPALESDDEKLTHGDFTSDHVLRDDFALWLLDLDSLRAGHVERDVATFLAHAIFDRLTQVGISSKAMQCVSQFVDCYRSLGGEIRVPRLRFYLPCAMARLGAIRLTRGLPTSVIEHFWELAERYIAESFKEERSS